MASVVRSARYATPVGRDRSARYDPRPSEYRPVDPGTFCHDRAHYPDNASARDGISAFQVQGDATHGRSLSELIESEIIPRLMLVHAADAPPMAPAASAKGDHRISDVEIAAFAPLVMQVEADALLIQVEGIVARGVPFDTLMVDLLAPTARLLGEYWEDDRCDFVDVTMGLWRLQEVIHEIAGRLPAERRSDPAARRVLFASLAGDQHHFGTVVIGEVFHRAGWQTERIAEAEPADLFRRVGEYWFDMIGLTITRECHIAGLSSIIAALRNVSRNPRLCVMVGGRIFSADPDLAAHVGADGTARDAKLALKLADDLVRAGERETAARS